MRFVEPLYALLLVPLLAGLWLSFRHVHGMAKNAKKAAFAMRALMAALVIAALMGPQSRSRNEGLGVVFVVDRSDSIRSGDREASYQFVKRAIEKLPPGDQAGVVLFGRVPVVESVPGGRRSIPAFTSKIDGTASDLAAAIRLASAIAPEGRGRRAVVLTDANETLGDAAEAVQAARLNGVQVDFVPLSTQSRGVEAAVLSVTAPQERRVDEPFDLRVAVSSSAPQSGILTVDRDGVVVSRKEVHLDQGTTSVLVPQRLASPGFFRYRATISPSQDGDKRNNIGAGFVEVKGRPMVLLLNGTTADHSLGNALREQGLSVKEGGPSLAPGMVSEIQPYDAVILNDLNAADVSLRAMEILDQGVRSGGIGLAMVGGENSFLPGGWYGTPVADALPVDLNVKQRKSMPSNSVLIMVDASGSMGMVEGGVPKIRLAAKAAEYTARLLMKSDRLAVGGSSDGIQLVLPFTDLHDREGAIARIRTLTINGGGIFAEPTIIEAEKYLAAENSKVRHFILVADGADTSDYNDSVRIVARMRASRITTSVVAVGDGKDVPFLKAVAAAGGGAFYLVTSAQKLPAIFTQDVSLITRSAIEEGAFTPKVTGDDPLLRGVFDSGSPQLLAYCISDSRPVAQTLLRTHKDDPLLAVWQYGLGRSLAFTSDAQARWASSWTRWSGFSSFWAQSIRSIMRRALDGRYRIEAAPRDGRVEVTVTAVNAQEGGAAPSKVVVALPGAKEQEVDLSEEAPGIFKGTAMAADPGSYMVTLAEQSGSGRPRVQSAGFAISYPLEYRTFAAQLPRLRQLAEGGGGRSLSRPEEALRVLSEPGETVRDIWFWFVLAAALLLPLDVAMRRISLPWREAVQRLRAKMARTKAPEQDGRLARLKSARHRPEAPPDVQIGPVKGTAASARPRPPSQADADGSSRERLLAARRKRRGGD